nr:hypothetical protein [uncultured Carboxylicivirga sp.]
MKAVVLFLFVIIISFDVSSQIKLTRVHSNMEAYEFNGGEKALHWVTNGRIALSSRDAINLEVIGAYYTRDGITDWTPGDFSITYSRSYASSKVGSSGWQGWSPIVKLVMPTGDPTNAAIFGHWILEPAVQYKWLLKDQRFYISNKWRYNFPLANTGEWPEPPILLRFEPKFGFTSDKWSAAFSLDNRAVFNQDAFVIYARVDAGYKLGSRSGLNAFYTNRVRHQVLFKAYGGIGFYYNF